MEIAANLKVELDAEHEMIAYKDMYILDLQRGGMQRLTEHCIEFATLTGERDKLSEDLSHAEEQWNRMKINQDQDRNQLASCLAEARASAAAQVWHAWVEVDSPNHAQQVDVERYAARDEQLAHILMGLKDKDERGGCDSKEEC